MKGASWEGNAQPCGCACRGSCFSRRMPHKGCQVCHRSVEFMSETSIRSAHLPVSCIHKSITWCFRPQLSRGIELQLLNQHGKVHKNLHHYPETTEQRTSASAESCTASTLVCQLVFRIHDASKSHPQPTAQKSTLLPNPEVSQRTVIPVIITHIHRRARVNLPFAVLGAFSKMTRKKLHFHNQ